MKPSRGIAMNDLRFFECQVVTEMDSIGNLETINLITAGANYAEAAARIEKHYGDNLVSFRIQDCLIFDCYETGDCIEFHFE